MSALEWERRTRPTGAARRPRALVAPDKFKGSLSASEVAAALSTGLRSAHAATDVVELPIADGGEGTVDAAVSCGFEIVECVVRGPLHRPLHARYAAHDKTAIIETAAASGMQLLTPGEAAPVHASTYGCGQLIADAIERGAETIVLGLGGSATTDGGAGMLIALGAVLTDSSGAALQGLGGAELLDCAAVDFSTLRERTAGVTFVVANDVTNPLVGKYGAAAVFGPQKGATQDDIRMLDQALNRFADIIATETSNDLRFAAGAGAAGGIGFAALAGLRAHPASGADVVLDLVGFDQLARDADLIVTGEGQLDVQSLKGKAPVVVAARAQRLGVPTIVVAGAIMLSQEQIRLAGFARSYALLEYAGDLDTSLRQAPELLARLGLEIGTSWNTSGAVQSSDV